MSIPPQKDIQIPLLHLIHAMGGVARSHEVFKILANYFRLTEKETEEMLPSGRAKKFNHHVQWARCMLGRKGLLVRYTPRLWKLTDKGRSELSRLGLIDKPFPGSTVSKDHRAFITIRDAQELKSDDEEIIQLISQEIAPNGTKKFPDDFLADSCTDFYEVELPGTQLYLAPLSQTIITSPKGYFRYQAKNPPEAKYILYAHNVGAKKVKVPKDNLTLFKVVKAYEKYCDEVARKVFELSVEFTNDEDKAELLTREVERRFNLRAKRTGR